MESFTKLSVGQIFNFFVSEQGLSLLSFPKPNKNPLERI